MNWENKGIKSRERDKNLRSKELLPRSRLLEARRRGGRGESQIRRISVLLCQPVVVLNTFIREWPAISVVVFFLIEA